MTPIFLPGLFDQQASSTVRRRGHSAEAGRGDAVLSRVGGKLTHDQRGGHGASADRCCHPQNFCPMGADERGIDATSDQRFERRVR
jgi:hypothetical protein